jgi:hypothetical protein
MKNGRLRLAALAGVVAIGMMAAPMAASAATYQPAASTSAHQHVTEVPITGGTVRPDFSNQWVNCSNGTFGTSGGQEYYEIACSLIDATSWRNGIECSNGVTYWSAWFTTFEDSTIYCPPGTAAEEGYVQWTE